MSVHVDEARHDRRVARVDHLPGVGSTPRPTIAAIRPPETWTSTCRRYPHARRRTAARPRRRSPPARPAAPSGRRRAAARSGAACAGAFRPLRPRRLGADLETNAAHGAGRSRRDSQRQRLAVGAPARPCACEPGSDGRDAPGLRELRDGEALARAGSLRLRFDECDSTPVAAHRRMSRLERAECDLTRRAAAKVDAPELELAATLAREHERSAVGREGGIEVHPDVVREPAQRAALAKATGRLAR